MPINIEQSINNEDEIVVSGIREQSRLQMFNIIKDDSSNYYFNIFKNYTMPDDIKNNPNLYDIYVVENNDWWDNIAGNLYKTTELWWLICFTNDIINPFEEIYPGQMLKIFKKGHYDIIIDKFKEIYNL